MTITLRPWMPLAAAIVLTAGCVAPAPAPTTLLSVESEAGRWKPLVVSDLASLRPAAPPAAGSPEAASEAKELRDWQARRSADDLTAIRYWNDQAAPLRWSELTRELVVKSGYVPPRAARALAAVHAAMYDAVIASWEAKSAYRRAAPVAAYADLQPVVSDAGIPSYPSEHAAVAAAAATMLGTIFPEEKEALKAKALAAAETRVAAGANYRSDVTAGFALGTAIAERVAARAAADGSEAKRAEPIPAAPHRWTHSAPMEPLAGSWKPWLLESGSQFRLPEPPRPGSAEFQAGLDEVVAVGKTLTEQQKERATYWNYDVPAIMWNDRTRQILAEHKASTPRAARTLGWVHAIMADAFIACWDTKYVVLQPRPDMEATGGWAPFVKTPPHPSYPSGHATCSSAAALYLSAVYPDVEAHVTHEAEEAAMSRLWGGIHYRRDNDDGLALGKRIGAYALEKAKADGTP